MNPSAGMRDLHKIMLATVREDGTMHLDAHQTKHLLNWLDAICTLCDEQHKLLAEVRDLQKTLIGGNNGRDEA